MVNGSFFGWGPCGVKGVRESLLSSGWSVMIQGFRMRGFIETFGCQFLCLPATRRPPLFSLPSTPEMQNCPLLMPKTWHCEHNTKCTPANACRRKLLHNTNLEHKLQQFCRSCWPCGFSTYCWHLLCCCHHCSCVPKDPFEASSSCSSRFGSREQVLNSTCVKLFAWQQLPAHSQSP